MNPSVHLQSTRLPGDELQNLALTDPEVQLALSDVASGHAPAPEITENVVEAEQQYWEEHGPPPAGYTRKDMHAKFLADTLLWMDETDKQLKAATAELAELDELISNSSDDEDGLSSLGSRDDGASSISERSNTRGGPSAAGDSKPNHSPGATRVLRQCLEKDYEPAAPTNVLEARRHVLNQLFTTPPNPPCEEPSSDQQPGSSVATEPWSRLATPRPQLRSFPASPAMSVFSGEQGDESEKLPEAYARLLRDLQRLSETYDRDREEWRQKENTMQCVIDQQEKSLETADNTEKSLRALNREMMHRMQGKSPNEDSIVLNSALEASAQSVRVHRAETQAKQKHIQALDENLKSERKQKNNAILACTTLSNRMESLQDHMKSAKAGAYALLRNAEIHLDKANLRREELELAVQRAADENSKLLRQATESERKLEAHTHDTVQSTASQDDIELVRGQILVAQKKVADLQAQNERLLRASLQSAEDRKKLDIGKTQAEQKLAEVLLTLRSDVETAEARATVMAREKDVAVARVSELEVTLKQTDHHKQVLRGKVTEANARTMGARNQQREQEKQLRTAEARLKMAHAKLQVEITEKQKLAKYSAPQKASADSALAQNVELHLMITTTNAAVANLQNINGTLQLSLDQALDRLHRAQSKEQQMKTALLAEEHKAGHLAHLLAVAQQTNQRRVTESTHETQPTLHDPNPLLLEQARSKILEQQLTSSQHLLHEARAYVGSLEAQLSAAIVNQSPDAHADPAPPRNGSLALMAHLRDLEAQKDALFTKVESLTEEKNSWERQFLDRNAHVIVMENWLMDWKNWLSNAPDAGPVSPPLHDNHVEIPDKSTHRIHFWQPAAASSTSDAQLGFNVLNHQFEPHHLQRLDTLDGNRDIQINGGMGITWDDETNCGDLTVDLPGDWMVSV